MALDVGVAEGGAGVVGEEKSRFSATVTLPSDAGRSDALREAVV